MYELELKGLPSIGVGDSMILPFPLIELLRTPMGVRISADDMYSHGGEIGRWLLSKTPIMNSKKYVNAYLTVHYLEGNLCHVPTTDWHCDGSNIPFLADDIFHTMICLGDGLDGQIKTEFLKEDVKIEIPDSFNIQRFDHQTFRRWITDGAGTYNLQPVECEAGRMYTWTSKHLHKVGFAKSPHFRMFWKVAESDFLTPKPLESAFSPAMLINNGVDHRQLEGTEINLEQGQRGIIIRGMKVGV